VAVVSFFLRGAQADAVLSAALRAKARGDEALLQSHLAALSDPAVQAAADRLLASALDDAVSGVWARGWQPVDLLCAAGRSVRVAAQSLLLDMIAAQLRQYPRTTVDEAWERQLALLGASVWWERDERHLDAFAAKRSLSRSETVGCVVEVLHLLTTLPLLPMLGPPPGQARRGSLASTRSDADLRMLERVRALLAKAERTDFPEEAEAYTAKAQELMTRHSIDYAMLSAPKAGERSPGGRRIPVENPYEAPKAILLGVIAKANRCNAVWSRELGFSTIVGFAADVAATELLFTSLLLQASTALRAAGTPTDRRTTSFRRSFLSAYANRIGQRLEEANRSVMDTASRDYGGDLLPVLAGRAEAVAATVGELFPTLTFHSVSAPSNRQGWIAGLVAADRAVLDQKAGLEHG
jgi:hypothetical protein